MLYYFLILLYILGKEKKLDVEKKIFLFKKNFLKLLCFFFKKINLKLCI
jgi:hypothetical protein